MVQLPDIMSEEFTLEPGLQLEVTMQGVKESTRFDFRYFGQKYPDMNHRCSPVVEAAEYPGGGMTDEQYEELAQKITVMFKKNLVA